MEGNAQRGAERHHQCNSIYLLDEKPELELLLLLPFDVLEELNHGIKWGIFISYNIFSRECSCAMQGCPYLSPYLLDENADPPIRPPDRAASA